MEKKKRASAISNIMFIIGVGIVFLTDWFWPGILIVLGVSTGADQIFNGKVMGGIGIMGFLAAVTAFLSRTVETATPWAFITPYVLIALAVTFFVKTVYLKDVVFDENPAAKNR